MRMNDLDIYQDLQRIISEQIATIKNSPWAENIVIGFNVYNDGQRLKNNRFHQDSDEYWRQFVQSFRVDSIVEGEDKFMINQISGVKDFKSIESEGQAQKEAVRMKFFMSLFKIAT